MPELIVKYLLSHQLHVTWLCDLSKSCFHLQFVLMRENDTNSCARLEAYLALYHL